MCALRLNYERLACDVNARYSSKIRLHGVSEKVCRLSERTLALSEGEETGAVRRSVIVAGRSARVSALVEQLQVARVDGHGLVGVGSDNVTVADVVCPAGTAVGLASERSALRSGLHSPRAVEAGGSERAEVAAVAALSFDDHEILVGTRDRVDLNSLEDLLRRVAQHNLGSGTEAAREVADGHLGVVDLAIVTAEEEVHAGAVANDGLVDGTRVGTGDGAGEHGLRRRPTVDLGRVAARPVRERSSTPLRGEHPDVLGAEVEERRCHSSLGHTSLSGRGHVRPGREGSEAHRAVLAVAIVGSINQMLSVVRNVGKILEVIPAVGRLSEGSRRSPAVGRRQSTGSLFGLRRGFDQCGDQASKGDEGGAELHSGNVRDGGD